MRPNFVPNTIKKKYLPGSPGAARKEKGVTLHAIRDLIDEPYAYVTQPIDELGNPVGDPIVVAKRDTAACTRRRRRYVASGLLAASQSTRKTRRKRNRAPACNTKKAA